MIDQRRSLSGKQAASWNAVPIIVAKARKQIRTMLTLGKVRVIGDSGALQIAIWQQI